MVKCLRLQLLILSPCLNFYRTINFPLELPRNYRRAIDLGFPKLWENVVTITTTVAVELIGPRFTVSRLIERRVRVPLMSDIFHLPFFFFFCFLFREVQECTMFSSVVCSYRDASYDRSVRFPSTFVTRAHKSFRVERRGIVSTHGNDICTPCRPWGV